MAKQYLMAGHKIHRRSTISLSTAERAQLCESGVTIVRALTWPPQLNDYEPNFDRAYVDPGQTEAWGPGPYLKVPNTQCDAERISRIFCPWGYPPDQVRVSRHQTYARIDRVGLALKGAQWQWQLTLTPAPV